MPGLSSSIRSTTSSSSSSSSSSSTTLPSSPASKRTRRSAMKAASTSTSTWSTSSTPSFTLRDVTMMIIGATIATSFATMFVIPNSGGGGGGGCLPCPTTSASIAERLMSSCRRQLAFRGPDTTNDDDTVWATSGGGGSSSSSNGGSGGARKNADHRLRDTRSNSDRNGDVIVNGADHDNDRDRDMGWKAVHVFYGKSEALVEEIPEARWIRSSPKHSVPGVSVKWFGQHGQDIVVQKILGFVSGGYFVDLAANDAVWASNTFGLETNWNWTGICIEPNPIYWFRLAHRRNCRVAGVVVGRGRGRDNGNHEDDDSEKNSATTVDDSTMERVNVTLSTKKEVGPYGGIVGDRFDNRRVSKRGIEVRYATGLYSVLQKFRAPRTIDYLSLDVEGAETYILERFAFDEYTFRVLSVERPSERLRRILRANEYEQVYKLKAGDTVWAHASILRQAVERLKEYPEEITNHAVTHFPPGALSE